eukprot:14205210-Alexandrium_andersonii.AAC.1
MSASLVGSEMCIRDSPSSLRSTQMRPCTSLRRAVHLLSQATISAHRSEAGALVPAASTGALGTTGHTLG